MLGEFVPVVKLITDHNPSIVYLHTLNNSPFASFYKEISSQNCKILLVDELECNKKDVTKTYRFDVCREKHLENRSFSNQEIQKTRNFLVQWATQSAPPLTPRKTTFQIREDDQRYINTFKHYGSKRRAITNLRDVAA